MIYLQYNYYVIKFLLYFSKDVINNINYCYINIFL